MGAGECVRGDAAACCLLLKKAAGVRASLLWLLGCVDDLSPLDLLDEPASRAGRARRLVKPRFEVWLPSLRRTTNRQRVPWCVSHRSRRRTRLAQFPNARRRGEPPSWLHRRRGPLPRAGSAWRVAFLRRRASGPSSRDGRSHEPSERMAYVHRIADGRTKATLLPRGTNVHSRTLGKNSPTG